jgi:hypothetical protein
MDETGRTAGSSRQTQEREDLSVKPPATGLIYCQHAKELLEALAESIRDLVLLHAEQFDSLITGDQDIMRFEALIHSANERKYEAKYKYRHHLDIHGCSKISGTQI